MAPLKPTDREELAAIRAMVDLISQNEERVLEQWMNSQTGMIQTRSELMSTDELRAQSTDLLHLFGRGISEGEVASTRTPIWEPARALLAELSASRALQGFTPSETAGFVFSLKETLADFLQKELGDQPRQLALCTLAINRVLDELGLFSFEVFVKTREETIQQQRRDLLELGTPCIPVWDQILAVPIIGVLDTARAQQLMEGLLQSVVESRSKVAILDITGVSAIDTHTASHLIKTVQAVQLLGCQAIVTGIRKEIAQTLVTLGDVNLGEVETRAALADGIASAFQHLGLDVSKRPTRTIDSAS